MPRSQLHSRTVYVYLSSAKEMDDWKAKAKKSRVPLSQFIYEHANNSLRQEEGEERFEPRAKLIEKLGKKDEEIHKLTEENHTLKLALEHVENELHRYRAEPFMEDSFPGVKKFDRQLTELLRKGKPIQSDQLLVQLRISPKETEVVKAVSRQLESLASWGLVRKSHHGWRWVE